MKVTKIFNNWAEVSEWWNTNPSAKRIEPNIEAEIIKECGDEKHKVTIEEFNAKNHSLNFPCEMVFEVNE